MHVSDRSFTQSVTEAIRGSFPGSLLGRLQARMLAAAGVELVNAILEQRALDPEADGDQLFALAAVGPALTATDWTAGRTTQTYIVLVARTDLSPAEIRHRLTTPRP